jgi:hypothetical protein
MTVSWRRSGLGAETALDACVNAPDGGIAAASFAPQELQKLEPGALSCWQASHVIDCGAPHWLQNRLPADNTAPQLRHAIADDLL